MTKCQFCMDEQFNGTAAATATASAQAELLDRALWLLAFQGAVIGKDGWWKPSPWAYSNLAVALGREGFEIP